MADHHAWVTGSSFKEGGGGSMKIGFVELNYGSIKDQSQQIQKSFKWVCRGRHDCVLMCSDEKHCRYCVEIEEHEDDHPLFWRGNVPICREDGSWK